MKELVKDTQELSVPSLQLSCISEIIAESKIDFKI